MKEGAFPMGILNLLNDFHNEENNLQWRGTFEEYLEMIKLNPSIAQRPEPPS